MAYSDWQLNRIRDALRAFRQYSYVEDPSYYEHYDEKGKSKRASLVKSFTWADVREAIAVATGVEIGVDMKKGAERLRQFVEGINDRENPGQKKFPVLKAEWLTAAVEFVTDKDKELLSEGELEDPGHSHIPMLKLLDYLDRELDSTRNIPVDRLHGRFTSQKADGDEFVVRRLELDKPTPDGLIKVIEQEESYEADAEQDFESWSDEDRSKARRAQIKHHGWAVVTPEDNLMFFMKNERHSNNRYYQTVASDLVSWKETPMSKLILLQQDFPLELEDKDAASGQQELTQQVLAEMAKGILLYNRTS